MNLERVMIRLLAFAPKDPLPNLPLYRNMTIPSPPLPPKEMFTTLYC